MKKILLVLLLSLSWESAFAEECIYDATSYSEFAIAYSAKNTNSEINSDFDLAVARGGEKIEVSGGGCDHLGYTIIYSSADALDELGFLNKVAALTAEFGGWIGYVKFIEATIRDSKWRVSDGHYFFDLDSMAVLIASHNNGKVIIEFYIN